MIVDRTRASALARRRARALLLAIMACVLWLLTPAIAPATAQQGAMPPARATPATTTRAGDNAGDATATIAPRPSVATPPITVAKERYRLFVFGDKMATGLLAGIWRVLKNDPNFLAKGRFAAGSGLTRARYYDWQRAISQVLKNQRVDIGVVMLGVNDVRDIFLRGRRIPFGSEEWKTIYANRVDAIMQAFRDEGVALYWVGLPPVRDAAMNAGVRLINDILKQRARVNGVRFIDIHDHFAGPDGRFVSEGPDINGRVVRLRARNGVHFIRPGNTRLAKIVIDVIRKDVEMARATSTAPGLAVAPQSDKPFVGNAGPDGTPLFVPPTLLPGENVVYLATPRDRGGAPRDTLQALRESAASGSPAHDLFTRGAWPAAPANRIDNFTPPPEMVRGEGK